MPRWRNCSASHIWERHVTDDVPADGDALVWSASLETWRPAPVSGVGPAPSATVSDESTLSGAPPNAGTAAAYSRGDHTHGTPSSPITVGEKAALAGTSGSPSDTNRYATDLDARLSDARAPTAHASAHHAAGGDALAHQSILGAGTNDHAALDSHVASAAPHAGHVQVGGQLGGSAASPDVRGLRETSGPTLLTLGAVGDGQTLTRSGGSIVGVTGGGGGLSHPQVMSRLSMGF